MRMTFEQAIKQAQYIAICGTVDEKEEFVSWCNYVMRALLQMGNIRAFNIVKAQYHAYLFALGR